MDDSRQAIIGIGGNVGDRWGNFRRALECLEASPGIQAVLPSPVYETAPVGILDQPSFLNMVAGLCTTLSPEDLLDLLLEIEHRMGRTRQTRWGPRPIDLDLLFYENEERNSPGLTLPHPRWAERTFVTVPLRDLLARPEFDRPAWAALRQKVKDATETTGIVARHPPLL